MQKIPIPAFRGIASAHEHDALADDFEKKMRIGKFTPK
jgi:hypothetical protein